MTQIELILEIPAEDGGEAELPDPGALPRTSAVAYVSGLDGEHVLQLGVLVGVGALHALRVWLVARAKRLKHTRVVWNGRSIEAYTAKEALLLIQALEREVHHGEDETSGQNARE
jgi:hypothetical protein